MATPIIDSVVASKTVVAPGETFTVRINAHDPDSISGQLQGTVTDLAGNPATAVITISVSDPLTYQLVDQGGGFTVVADAAVPGLFHVTAP